MDHNFLFRRFLTMEVWKLSVKNLSRKIYFWQWNNGYSWQGHRKLNRKWLGWERNFYFLWFWAQDFHFETLPRKHLAIHGRPFAERPGLGSKIRETDRSGPWSRPDHNFLTVMNCSWRWPSVKRFTIAGVISESNQGQIRVRFEFDRVIPQFSIQPNFLHQLTNDASPHSPKVLEGAPSWMRDNLLLTFFSFKIFFQPTQINWEILERDFKKQIQLHKTKVLEKLTLVSWKYSILFFDLNNTDCLLFMSFN